MKQIFFLFFLFVGVHVSAQDLVVNKLRAETARTIKKEVDTSHWQWKSGGLFSFTLSQGSLSNWASGGDNFSLAANSYLNYFFYYKHGRQSWDNNVDLNLGYVNTTSSGGRKNDDRMDYLSKWGYKIDSTGRTYLTGLFNFRSQFFDGYNYGVRPADLSSSFLSPAYVVTSIGLDFKHTDRFSLFLSPFTSRWTLIANNYLSQKGLYGLPKGAHSLNEFGAFATINFFTKIGQNIGYKGRLDLFSNYASDPQNVDVFMTNQFSFKINKNFSATYGLDFIYDDNVRLFGGDHNAPGLQLKSLIGIGFLKPLNLRKRM